MTVDVLVFFDHVVIEGIRIDKPSRISVSGWLEFWEEALDDEDDHDEDRAAMTDEDRTCVNRGYIDRWTCPGCYSDIPNAIAGRSEVCRNCGRIVECTLEYEPVCRSRLSEEQVDG